MAIDELVACVFAFLWIVRWLALQLFLQSSSLFSLLFVQIAPLNLLRFLSNYNPFGFLSFLNRLNRLNLLLDLLNCRNRLMLVSISSFAVEFLQPVG